MGIERIGKKGSRNPSSGALKPEGPTATHPRKAQAWAITEPHNSEGSWSCVRLRVYALGFQPGVSRGFCGFSLGVQSLGKSNSSGCRALELRRKMKKLPVIGYGGF